jgi:conjugal transfer mating pair stabilization protein TraG
MTKVLVLLSSLITASTLFADPIHTHGGGELLDQVFKVVSKILYGDHSNRLEQTFNALLKISLTVGAFCALLLAFFRQKFEPLIRSFLIPGIVIVGFLLVPRTSVEIIEKESPKEKRETIVVPFFLGKFAAWTSYSFDRLHHLFKNAIGDVYPWTTNIYKGKKFLKSGSIPLSDPLLEENFREFCRECVFRDLGLGLYTKKELGEASNLLEFLAARTSEKRAIAYNGEAISCQDAIEAIKKSIEETSPKTIDHVDLLFNAPQNNLSVQKIAIDLLQEEIFSPGLKSQKIESLGAQATVALMSLRSFFEAVLYLIFPLIVLLSLLTFGIRMALLWVRCIVWVCTWPIFYLATDLFLSALWKFRGSDTMLNLANATRLSDQYSSMETIACACVATIPFLSWFLIKEGSQLVHVASSFPQQEKIAKAAEPEPQKHHSFQDDLQDISRQTHWGVLAKEPERSSSEDGFKANIEGAMLEERIDSLQSSLSSIRESVKDSSTHISKAVKEANHPLQTEHSHLPSPALTPKAEEVWGSAQMHLPSHGSWSTGEKLKDTEPA